MYTSVKNLSDSTISDQIADNIIDYFNWGFLSIGGFFNVRQERLKLSPNPNYIAGRIWESSHAGWVWESGLPRTGQPIPISGIYVNNVFKPNGDGYFIDYEDSQVIFDNAMPAATIIKMDYSYRRYNFYDNEVSWFHQVAFDPLPASGVNTILAQNRVYLPAILVETPPSKILKGFELGSAAKVLNQDLLFYVIADKPSERTRIADIMADQFHETIMLYDLNAAADADAYPLLDDGSLSSNPKNYPQLVESFPYTKALISNVRMQEVTSDLPLFRAIVRFTLQVDIP